jgi:hypothetical protein
MTMLKAITKGLTILTAASSLLAGLPRYDCLCASTKSRPAPAIRHPIAPKTTAAPDCCCCGSCGHESSNGTSCCGRTRAVAENADCCNEVAPESQKPASNDDQFASFSCQRCWSQVDVAYVAATRSADSELNKAAFGWVLHFVPREVPAGNLCSPFRWKQYQLPPPPDLIITLQHYLI